MEIFSIHSTRAILNTGLRVVSDSIETTRYNPKWACQHIMRFFLHLVADKKLGALQSLQLQSIPSFDILYDYLYGGTLELKDLNINPTVDTILTLGSGAYEKSQTIGDQILEYMISDHDLDTNDWYHLKHLINLFVQTNVIANGWGTSYPVQFLKITEGAFADALKELAKRLWTEDGVDTSCFVRAMDLHEKDFARDD